jgi:hypothetical protein
MSDPRDPKLEALLRSRPLVPPSPDLVARIAIAARMRPQTRPLSVSEWLAQLFAEFRLPRPAIAMSALLLLGVVAGWSAPLALTGPDDDADTEALQMQSFLYADDEEPT